MIFPIWLACVKLRSSSCVTVLESAGLHRCRHCGIFAEGRYSLWMVIMCGIGIAARIYGDLQWMHTNVPTELVWLVPVRFA